MCQRGTKRKFSTTLRLIAAEKMQELRKSIFRTGEIPQTLPIVTASTIASQIVFYLLLPETCCMLPFPQ
jgi:hypothetical protein